MTPPPFAASWRGIWLLPLLLALMAAAGATYAPFFLPMDKMHLAWVDMDEGRDRDLWAIHLLYRNRDGTEPLMDEPYLLTALSALARQGRHDEFDQLAGKALQGGGGSAVLRAFIKRQKERSDRTRAGDRREGTGLEHQVPTSEPVGAGTDQAAPAGEQP